MCACMHACVCVRVGVAVCELFVYYNALCLYGASACVCV